MQKPKRKLLTAKEVKSRMSRAATEVATDLFGLAGKVPEELDSELAFLRAGFLYATERLQPKLIKSTGKRYTEEELKTEIAKIKASEAEVATMLRKKLKEIQKELPRQGGPGRNEKLSATEKAEVCEQIASIVKLGQLKKMPDIFNAVAENLKLTKGKVVSARTVKRAWEKRAALYAG